MLPLSLIATRAGLLVHQGGVTMTAAALALGLPQLILARFHENGLAGAYIAREGLGEVLRMDHATRDWLVDAVARLRADRALAERARARAPEFREWFADDPTAVVAMKAAEMLNIRATPAPPATGEWLWSPI